MALTAAQLAIKIGADTSEAESGFGKIKALMSPQSALLLGAGAVAGAFVGIGVAAVTMAGNFQEGMTSLVTGAGLPKAALKQVSDGILQMAKDTGTSTDQLAQGMYMISSTLSSAGYTASQELDVLRAAAEGAKVGAADLGTVADATTTIMTDYKGANISAAQAVNTLVSTVAQGKTHMEDLSGALASALPTAASYKVHLNDVMGALATMTAAGIPAADAATYLRQTLIGLGSPTSAAAKALASVGLSTAQVNAEMQKSLPDTLKMITDAVGKKFPAGSVQYNEAIKAIAGGSKQMQGMLALTGDHLKTFQQDVQNISGAVQKGGSSIQGWSDVQGDFNFKMSQLQQTINTLLIGLGQHLLPVLGQVASTLSGGLSYAMDHAHQLFQQWQPVLIVVAGIIGGALVAALYTAAAALWATLAPVLAFLAPFLAVGAAIGLVVVGFKHLYDTSAPFRAVINALVAAVKGEFLAIWHQLVALWNSDLLPAFQQVQAAFQQALPILRVVGAIIGGVLVVALGLLIGTIRGLVAGIAVLVAGFAQAFAGIIQLVVGFVHLFIDYWGGLFAMLKDIFTGNWSQLGKDAHTFLDNMIKDLGQMLGGLVTMVGGILKMLVGAPLAQIKGFVDGVIGFFQGLFDHLVGHSIVPDMVNGIIGLFAGLPGKALGAVGNLTSNLEGFFGGVATNALKWGGSIISNITSGITGALGGLTSAVQGGIGNALSGLKNVLGGIHIPGFATGGTMPDTGLAVVGEAGPELVKLPAGAQVAPFASASASSLTGGAGVSGLPAGMAPVYGLAQGRGANGQPIVVQLYVDGRQLAQIVTKYQPGIIRQATGARAF